MANNFEDLVNNMVNIGFGAVSTAAGAAATAAEKGKEVLGDLAAKGQEARHDSSAPDFARSMSDIFEKAGGVFTDVTARLSSQGETLAERVLDELILARARQLSAVERAAFVKHVGELVDNVEDAAVAVEVESVETETAEDDTSASEQAAAADGAAADEQTAE